MRVWSLTDFRTREVRVSVLVLAAGVTMVLLVACVNVANPLLARAGARRSEVAVRLAQQMLQIFVDVGLTGDFWRI